MDEIKRYFKPLLRWIYQPVMRQTRGQTLGARCAVFDAQKRVLLIRHSYAPGWAFPGGGVERSETLQQAIARELEEEAGVVLEAPARLHGIFANFHSFPGDHVAFFVAERWRQPRVPARSLEIVEQRFFALDELPDNLTAATRRRLDELTGAAELSDHW